MTARVSVGPPDANPGTGEGFVELGQAGVLLRCGACGLPVGTTTPRPALTDVASGNRRARFGVHIDDPDHLTTCTGKDTP